MICGDLRFWKYTKLYTAHLINHYNLYVLLYFIDRGLMRIDGINEICDFSTPFEAILIACCDISRWLMTNMQWGIFISTEITDIKRCIIHSSNQPWNDKCLSKLYWVFYIYWELFEYQISWIIGIRLAGFTRTIVDYTPGTFRHVHMLLASLFIILFPNRTLCNSYMSESIATFGSDYSSGVWTVFLVGSMI